MGQRIAALALDHHAPPVAVVGAVEARQHAAIGTDIGVMLGRSALGVLITDDLANALKGGDVLIEFTNPEATMDHARVAAALGKPMVVGTTGLSPADQEVLRGYARNVPIVLSPNMSVGVNLLFEFVRLAAQRLGLRYQVSIQETHHAGKKDTPSGTAKRLQEVLADARGQQPGAVPCESIRTGEVVGEHTVTFEGPFERVRLHHEALSRDVFASGALRAALFVSRKRAAGLYDMSDVLNEPEGARAPSRP